MPYLIGFHLEGTDDLILKCLLARLLEIEEEAIQAEVFQARSGGWTDLIATIPKALHRFYGQCARAVLIGMDNDGDRDLTQTGNSEDPRHPRHWNHPDTARTDCRYCQMAMRVASQRAGLNWIPNKAGEEWPIIITVPVETIEAWLLTAKAQADPGQGSFEAESLPRSVLKQRFYGKPFVTREDVKTVALPLLRQADLSVLRKYSHSFDDFAQQVLVHAEDIRSAPPCW